MMKQPRIKVGIHTKGRAETETLPSGMTRIKNAVIGIGFHWERVFPLMVKGEILAGEQRESTIGLIVGIDAEDYLRSVVSSEMAPTAPEEYLKAHAIISRSWLLGKVSGCHAGGGEGKEYLTERITDWADTSDHDGFHVCNDDHCQRFQGEECVARRASEAVEATRGIVLADRGGGIADARFSKCCGGRTEIFSTCWQNEDLPYLKSFPDPYCLRAPEMSGEVLATVMKDYDRDSTPDFLHWQTVVGPELIKRRLKEIYGRDIGEIRKIEPVSYGPSGRILRLKLYGSSGVLSIGKELAVRRMLSDSHLLSSAFTIEERDGKFHLTGRGWGHGVGLCQIGAAVMALEGKSAGEILQFYYPETKLVKLYD